MDKPKRLTFEQLIKGEVAVSWLNEPLPPEPPRESATARAMRIWFKQNPSGMSGAREATEGSA